MDENRRAMNRRRFVACFSAGGLGSTLLPGALAAVADDTETITIEMVQAAQSIAGLSFTRAEQQTIVERLNGERSPRSGFDLRMRAMEQVHEAMSDLDLFIGSYQALTNRTGHPVLSLPNGFSEGSPTALHLTGKLFGEPEILLLAHAFQANTDHHTQHPPL